MTEKDARHLAHITRASHLFLNGEISLAQCAGSIEALIDVLEGVHEDVRQELRGLWGPLEDAYACSVDESGQWPLESVLPSARENAAKIRDRVTQLLSDAGYRVEEIKLWD